MFGKKKSFEEQSKSIADALKKMLPLSSISFIEGPGACAVSLYGNPDRLSSGVCEIIGQMAKQFNVPGEVLVFEIFITIACHNLALDPSNACLDDILDIVLKGAEKQQQERGPLHDNKTSKPKEQPN